MAVPIRKFYEFIDQPLFERSRILIALLVIPMVLVFFTPIWKISMEAPQYPDGLWMSIHAYKLEAGNEGQHIKEINTLNHYIGMAPIDRQALSDLDWIPFAFGILILLTLRTAAIGDVRSLLDLTVLTIYVSLAAFARFAYRLYYFGHNLSDEAPVKVEPFTPAILGTKQVANFTTHSYPEIGSLFLGIFAVGLVLITLWHLWAGRRRAVAELSKA